MGSGEYSTARTESYALASAAGRGRDIAVAGMNPETLRGRTVSTPAGHVQLGELLGTGAEGAVFRVSETPTDAVKVFTPEKRSAKADKIESMIARPPADPTLTQRGVRSIVWPTETVEDAETGSFLGYTMPYVDLSQYQNVQRYAASELQWADTPATQRYKTALNLASVVDAIHQQDHAIGDMNHRNILVNDGYVSLIDCDAFHIRGERESYAGEMFFPRYTPPEGRGNTIDDVRRADRFGLAVHIFQLLMEGYHPFQAHGPRAAKGDFEEMIQENAFPYEDTAPGGIEPHPRAPAYGQLPAAIKAQFSDCFAWGKRHQRGRPTPREWIRILRAASGVSSPAQERDAGGGSDVGTPPETPTRSEPDWTDDYQPDPFVGEETLGSFASRIPLPSSLGIGLANPLANVTVDSISERVLRLAYYVVVFLLCFLVFYVVLTAFG